MPRCAVWTLDDPVLDRIRLILALDLASYSKDYFDSYSHPCQSTCNPNNLCALTNSSAGTIQAWGKGSQNCTDLSVFSPATQWFSIIFIRSVDEGVCGISCAQGHVSSSHAKDFSSGIGERFIPSRPGTRRGKGRTNRLRTSNGTVDPLNYLWLSEFISLGFRQLYLVARFVS